MKGKKNLYEIQPVFCPVSSEISGSRFRHHNHASGEKASTGRPTKSSHRNCRWVSASFVKRQQLSHWPSTLRAHGAIAVISPSGFRAVHRVVNFLHDHA